MTPIAIFIFLVFLFTLISKRIEKTILTAPLIFILGGISVYLFLPRVAEREIHNETVLLIAELTLALLLLTDATHIDLRKLLKAATFPLRLLGFGIPLTLLVGAITTLLLLQDFSIREAALLVVILAPTDAGLGQVVVKASWFQTAFGRLLALKPGLMMV